MTPRVPFNKDQRRLKPNEMRRARIPGEFWSVSTKLVPELGYRSSFSEYMKQMPEGSRDRKSLVLMGQHDSGKTSLGVIALKNVISYGGSALFVTASEVIGFTICDEEFDEDYSIKQRMESVDLLLIDELGAEVINNNANMCIENLVRKRLGRMLGTVFTSNHNYEALCKRYPGIMSALKGTTMFINVNGMRWRENKQRVFNHEMRSRISD